MRLLVLPVLVCLLYVFVCVTCVIIGHLPNENKCSALLGLGTGAVAASSLSLSELGGYFDQGQH